MEGRLPGSLQWLDLSPFKVGHHHAPPLVKAAHSMQLMHCGKGALLFLAPGLLPLKFKVTSAIRHSCQEPVCMWCQSGLVEASSLVLSQLAHRQSEVGWFALIQQVCGSSLQNRPQYKEIISFLYNS